MAQGGCSRPQDPGNFHLATVAASPEHGLLFIAQPGFPAVDVLHVGLPHQETGAPTHVSRLPEAARSHVLRLAVDRERGRLWVADFRLMQVYALPGLEELRRYDLPKDSYHDRFSDFAIDSSGNVLVLSRGGARIHRIDARSLEMAPWLDIADNATDTALLLANRVLKSPDDRFLFLASPTEGALLRVDMHSKQVVALSDGAANLSCGLLFWADGSADIRAFDCTGRWDAYIKLGADGRSSSLAFRGQQRSLGSIARFEIEPRRNYRDTASRTED